MQFTIYRNKGNARIYPYLGTVEKTDKIVR